MQCLTLTGWAQAPDALNVLCPGAESINYQQTGSIEEALEMLEGVNPDYVIAWSLGSVIAMQAIAASVIAPKRLILLSPIYQFIADEYYSHAMPHSEYDQFYRLCSTNIERALTRFSALILHGSKSAIKLPSFNKENTLNYNNKILLWIDMLSKVRMGDAIIKQLPETLIIHGKKDAIVPFTQAETFKEKSFHTRLQLVEEGAHALHLEYPEHVKQWISEFIDAQ
jgi:pimeloyl-[acyl-carrier protein] methyl ester esterase